MSTILETLLIPALYKTNGSANGQESDVDRRVKGFMDFEDGLDIFVDMAGINTVDVRDDDLETRFKDALLDKEYGLRCILFKHPGGKKFIVLDSDSFDMVAFLQEIIENDEQITKQADEKLLPIFIDDLVKDAIQYMDTEYDKKVLKVLLASFLNYDQLNQIGIKPEKAKNNLNNLREVWEEMKNTEMAAADMIKLRLNERTQRISDNLEILKEKEKQNLSAKRLGELRAKKEILEERLADVIELKNGELKISKQKFNQAVKRLTKKLFIKNRMKNRKLGAGAKRALDSEDEEFIANAIESKSTAHGRIHDPVLYTGHRVKHRDLLSIANYSLYKRGKRLIRSSTTVFNRSRPKRINSVQGKRHLGNLFSLQILDALKYR